MPRIALTSLFAVLALSSSVSFAASKKTLVKFSDDLCSQVASNGDENGTDSADAYRSKCSDDLAAKNLTSAKAIVRAICPNVEEYSGDLNENKDDDKTDAQLQALKKALIKQCFNDADELAIKADLDL